MSSLPSIGLDAHGIPLGDPLTQRTDDPGTRGRTVYVDTDRLFQELGSVTEFFDDATMLRFLACTCDEFKGNGLVCKHIQKVYEDRLDIYEVPEDDIGRYPTDTGKASERIALPHEVCLGDYEPYKTSVVILAKKHRLTIEVKLYPFGDNDRFVEPFVMIPGNESEASLGVAPRNVGRGELRTMFVEWIMTSMATEPDIQCTKEWHEAWAVARQGTGFVPDRETLIISHWSLMNWETCIDCITNSDIPDPYNPLEGVLRNARSNRQQSRSRANGGT